MRYGLTFPDVDARTLVDLAQKAEAAARSASDAAARAEAAAQKAEAVFNKGLHK